MPPNPTHHRTDSHPSYPRASILPTSSSTTLNRATTSTYPTNPTTSQYQSTSSSSSIAGSASMSAAKTRQYAHLHAQLAQLNANLADTENLLRMTAVQAGDMRFLGGYMGALFMGGAKVLGEEGVKGKGAASGEGDLDDHGGIVKKEESEDD